MSTPPEDRPEGPPPTLTSETRPERTIHANPYPPTERMAVVEADAPPAARREEASSTRIESAPPATEPPTEAIAGDRAETVERAAPTETGRMAATPTAPIAAEDRRTEVMERDPVVPAAPVPTRDSEAATRPVTRAPVLRVPSFAPLAPFGGWLAAWGAAALAASCLVQANVDLGLGLGIADADVAGLNDGFRAGLWLLIIQAGAFIVGGYVAARMARNRGTLHAVLAWLIAMLATGADALVQYVRDGGRSVLADLRIPYWIENGYPGGWDTAVALGIFALAALAGALIGGGLGSAANAAAKRDVAVDRRI
jgi:hypothetical protein